MSLLSFIIACFRHWMIKIADDNDSPTVVGVEHTKLTDPFLPGKLKKTSGPFRCGIWRKTFKSFAECLGCKEEIHKKHHLRNSQISYVNFLSKMEMRNFSLSLLFLHSMLEQQNVLNNDKSKSFINFFLVPSPLHSLRCVHGTVNEKILSKNSQYFF